jgi:MFS family permease
MPAKTLVFLVCLAQVLVQLGAFVWPALLPGMITLWNLSNGEAGWITAIFYGAYMVAVPVLVTLTDRIDAKYVYLFGVALMVLGHLMFVFVADGFATAMFARTLAGVGWAGTYMTGLKLLADKVDDKLMSRAVAGHAASIGISGALSFSLAAALADFGGWQMAFAVSAATAACAWLIIAVLVPWSDKPPKPVQAGKPFLDFGPVFRNRSAMAYAFVYCIHTLEMSALRGWGVAFLAFVAASHGVESTVLSPTMVATSLALIGALASITGNEGSIRFGRRRLIVLAMLGSILIGGTIGFIGPISYQVAVGMMLLYGVVVWLDSSSLTAGTAGSAEPERRGATLAVHSMLGYAGGFVGPLIVGIVLDAAGGHSSFSWGMSFATVAALMVVALVVFVAINPRELAGDRAARAKIRSKH